MEKAYIIIDGDDAGLEVERFILTNDLDSLIRRSRAISALVQELADALRALAHVSLVHAGGDSIVVEVAAEGLDEARSVIRSFQGVGTITFSAGVGRNLRESYVALRVAKTSGKGRTVQTEE